MEARREISSCEIDAQYDIGKILAEELGLCDVRIAYIFAWFFFDFIFASYLQSRYYHTNKTIFEFRYFLAINILHMGFGDIYVNHKVILIDLQGINRM